MPEETIRCRNRTRDLGVRSGGSRVRSVSCELGKRIATDQVEIPASSTVKDLAAGSDFAFDHRWVYPLKRIPGEWRVFSVRA